MTPLARKKGSIDPTSRTGRQRIGDPWTATDTLVVPETGIWVNLPKLFANLDEDRGRWLNDGGLSYLVPEALFRRMKSRAALWTHEKSNLCLHGSV